MEVFKDIMDDFDDIVGIEKKPVVYVGFVEDHSGSMRINANMAMNNFNEQIQTIKDNNDVDSFIVTVEFSDKIKINDMLPVDKVKEKVEYWTNGMTALNDAIAKTIYIISEKMNNSKYVNKSALIIVITDGHENASEEYPTGKGTSNLREMIEKLEDSGEWTFTFMGEGLDIQKYAIDSLGMKQGNTICFDGCEEGYELVNEATKAGLRNFYNTRSFTDIKNVSNFYADVEKEQALKEIEKLTRKFKN